MISVLVTGAGGGVGQGIIKSLKLIQGISVRIIAADMSERAPGLYSVDASYLVPAAASDDYIDRLAEIFQNESIDYYLPGTDVELVFCARNAAYFKEIYGVDVVVSPLEAIEVSDDKFKTFQFLNNNDMPYPASFLGEDVDPNAVKYPVIVKPRIGCRSIGVSVAENVVQLSNRLKAEKDLVVQELIGNDEQEYTCTIVVANGVPSDVLALKRTLRAGDTFTAEPVESDVISKYVTKAALSLNINGSCNFQLRLDSEGVPKIFEINCRFSGTTPFCAQLGFNPVEFYLKQKMGLPYSYEVDYDSFVLRHWSEVIVKKSQMKTLKQDKYIKPEQVLTSIL